MAQEDTKWIELSGRELREMPRLPRSRDEAEVMSAIDSIPPITLKCNFLQDEGEGDFYKALEDKCQDTSTVIRVPVKLWRRVVLWLLGVRPFPPAQQEFKGKFTKAKVTRTPSS